MGWTFARTVKSMYHGPADAADRLQDPALYDGIIFKRVFAYLIDAVILFAVGVGMVAMGIMSFGLLLPLIWPVLPVIPLAYHTLTVGSGGSATIGMRICGIRVVTVDGYPPNLLQAFVLALVFYLTIGVTSGLVLLVALFTDRGRCLHDFVAGTLAAPAHVRLR